MTLHPATYPLALAPRSGSREGQQQPEERHPSQARSAELAVHVHVQCAARITTTSSENARSETSAKPDGVSAKPSWSDAKPSWSDVLHVWNLMSEGPFYQNGDWSEVDPPPGAKPCSEERSDEE
eukprot:CAMPEP_0182499102 /NCGR_PEP_ID=MMETSP1321-20130603/7088_1 /TAXON_ID=91990 /ORGANISM="Bolidomonas sp., Strain RCC1657" /LENGTH=123 /DNA_ID=CAMNT_0024703243 /DNA_START=208 /DNA_END=575 /DNA_ORIENTATION=+